ncbi:MAG: efflux transporter outer membrane subunit [Lysobacterales bacterium]
MRETQAKERSPFSGMRLTCGVSVRMALLAGFATLALTSCVLGPDYHRPDVPLPQTWRTPAGEAANVVNTAWWQGFKDQALDALIQKALDANMDLLQATEHVKQFEAKLQIAGADKYPQLDYNAGAERRRFSTERPVPIGVFTQPTQNLFQTGISAGWELDIWGKVRRANEAALADLLSAQDTRHAVMLTVVNDVATAYFNLLAMDRELALASGTLDTRKKALDLITTRYKGGQSSKLAVLQAQAAVSEVWVKIPDIEHQITTLENALSLLLGQNPGTIIRGTDDKVQLPEVPAGVPADILSRRPDVLAAEQNLIAANARIGVAKAEFLPTISLTGLLGVASSELSELTDHSATEASIGAGVLGPIFSGGRMTGDVKVAESVQRELVIKYRQSVQTALADVEDALDFNVRAAEEARRGVQQVESLRDLVNLAQVRFEGGQSDYLEVLTAEEKLYKAEAEQVDRHRDTYLALVSVYAAMGGGWMQAQDKLHAATTEHAAAPKAADTSASPSGKPVTAATTAAAEPANAAANAISQEQQQ